MVGNYLQQQGRTYWVRMVVPRDVQPIIGKKVLKQTTGQRDYRDARAVAIPIARQWQRQIEDARRTGQPPATPAPIDQPRRAGQRSLPLAAPVFTPHPLSWKNRAERDVSMPFAPLHPPERVEPELDLRGLQIPDRFKAVAEEMQQQMGPDVIPFEEYEAQMEGMALASLPSEGEARAFVRNQNNLLDHLDEWHAQLTNNTPRGRREYRRLVQRFAAEVPQSLESLRSVHVQKWINGKMNGEKALDAQTMNKWLGALRNFWAFLADGGYIKDPDDGGIRPFAGRKVKNRYENEINKIAPERYEPVDVVRLWRAVEISDPALAAMIKIAAYTGARRESICQLKAADIRRDPSTGIRFLHFGAVSRKSNAGVRDVPIHSQIVALIDRLSLSRDKDGFLIHSTAANQDSRRSDPLGKRFGSLKTRLGFGPQHDFHSIRRTLIHLFETAECPENITKDIVGHKKSDITYGLYSGKTRLDHRKEWLEKAIVYPAGESAE